jgi:hypothetical protein
MIPKIILRKEQKENIDFLYIKLKLPLKEVERRTGISYHVIKKYLISLGITIIPRNHKFFCDDSFFDKIESEEQAYFLGLLCADGCVRDNKTIYIYLQESDLSILQKFKKSINFNGNIVLKPKNNKKCQNGYYINIYSEKMYYALIKLGCTPRKSLTLKFPTSDQVPDHLIHHFIRGYFDGDGCIHISKKGQHHFNIVGTFEFIDKLNEVFSNRIGIDRLNLSKDKRCKNNFMYQTAGNLLVYKIYNFLYKNANFFIDRKYEKFKRVEEKAENSPAKTYKYKGVIPKNGGFIAQVWNKKKNQSHYIGRFLTEKEAAEARDMYIINNNLINNRIKLNLTRQN